MVTDRGGQLGENGVTYTKHIEQEVIHKRSL